MGDRFADAWPAFDRAGFVSAAANNLEALELKERSDQIVRALAMFLPEDFERAAHIMLRSLATDSKAEGSGYEMNDEGIGGWAIMPMTHYAGIFGLEHFDLSMNLLKEMTKRFSSEFGIRFLILADRKRALAIMRTWTRDSNCHVRRLVSEGTRPRLPWAMQLPAFIADPSPVLPLLEALKDDESEYVRRSVANNLNDVAKDHPDIVSDIAEQWLRKASPDRQRLVRHACRTLIKQGHKKTLQAFGFGPPKVKLKHLRISTPQVNFGEALLFELSILSISEQSQPLTIDYAVHHQKANGKTTPKVFKWKTIALDKKATHVAKRVHSIRPITTRTYYAGAHRLEILINGVSVAQSEFELVM